MITPNMQATIRAAEEHVAAASAIPDADRSMINALEAKLVNNKTGMFGKYIDQFRFVKESDTTIEGVVKAAETHIAHCSALPAGVVQNVDVAVINALKAKINKAKAVLLFNRKTAQLIEQVHQHGDVTEMAKMLDSIITKHLAVASAATTCIDADLVAAAKSKLMNCKTAHLMKQVDQCGSLTDLAAVLVIAEQHATAVSVLLSIDTDLIKALKAKLTNQKTALLMKQVDSFFVM